MKLKVKNAQEVRVPLSDNEILTEYYKINDSVNSLERLRTYQLNDIMSRRNISKYKLFYKILPSLTGQAISTIKDSSIVSIISIQELTFQGMELMASTYLVFEVWITITAMYFILTLSLSSLASFLEGRMVKY